MLSRAVHGRWHSLSLARWASRLCDAAGPHWLTAWEYWECASPPWRAWFAGNFWWADLAFLRRLPVPAGPDRFAAEQWIGGTVTPVVLDLLPGRPLDGLEEWAAETMKTTMA